jgi:hypothetical protein
VHSSLSRHANIAGGNLLLLSRYIILNYFVEEPCPAPSLTHSTQFFSLVHSQTRKNIWKKLPSLQSTQREKTCVSSILQSRFSNIYITLKCFFFCFIVYPCKHKQKLHEYLTFHLAFVYIGKLKCRWNRGRGCVVKVFFLLVVALFYISHLEYKRSHAICTNIIIYTTTLFSFFHHRN